MSERSGFAGGFILGAIIGGIVGGVVGTVVTQNKKASLRSRDQSLLDREESFDFDTEEGIEETRRTLEDKIAQLNSAIDDVRQQLGTVNGNE
jgi:hypothetical protein